MNIFKKKWFVFIILALLVCGVFIFFYNSNKKQSNTEKDGLSANKMKVGLITGFGGLGDKSFNDMQYKGMILARKQFNIDFEYLAPKTNEDNILLIEELIKKNCMVIICGGGYTQIDALDSLAVKYPQVLFVLLDDFPKKYYKNVASITYKQNESSYLAGALAALVSKTGRIAVLGAMDLEVINDFIKGFTAGSESVSQNVKVIKKYISNGKDNIDPFASPEIAKKIALSLYSRDNVDIIFPVASASGLGVFAAAKEKNKFALGVDADQDYLAEGNVLTSVMKNLDSSIVFIIDEIINGKFKNKNYSMGLKEGGVCLSPMTYTRNKISPNVLEKIEKIKLDIIAGKIIVPSAYSNQ